MNELVSACLGIIVGVIIEDPLTRMRDSVFLAFRRLLYKKPARINHSEKFSFGSIDTSWYIVDGDGELIYTPKTITTHYENNYLQLPTDIKKCKEHIEREQVSKRKKGEEFFGNGDRYYLEKFSINRSDYKENLELQLFFGPSDYYTFLATNMRAQEEEISRKYVSETFYQTPLKFFSNSFGINLVVITADEYVLIPKRSVQVGVNKQAYGVSVNEGLSRTFDRGVNGQSPDMYRAAIRGAVEELGLNDITANDIKFLSFGVDTTYLQWGLLGMARTNKTAEEILRWRTRGVKDKWENSEINTVKWNIHDVVTFVFSHSHWTPAGLTCLYQCLVHDFRRTAVDNEIAKYAKKQS